MSRPGRRSSISARLGWTSLELLEPRRVFAAGDLDLTFGDQGLVRTEFEQSATTGRMALATVVQSDGRVIVAGEGTLARVLADGRIDLSFGSSGRVAPPFYVRAVALQADGKLLAAGGTSQFNSTDMVIARYLPDGSLDNSWDDDGVVEVDFGGPSEWANALLVEPSGRVVVAGGARQSVALARLQSNGQLDSNFNGSGKLVRQFTQEDTAYGLARQSNGRILVVGTSYHTPVFGGVHYDMFALRINTNGTVDGTFDGDGIQHINFLPSNFSRDLGHAIAVQADGRIVVSGSAYGNFTTFVGVARLNSDGSLDQSFGTNGRFRQEVTRENSVGDLLITADQKLLVTSIGGMIRLNSDGSLDSSFGINGRIAAGGTVNAAALQADGSILLAGSLLGGYAVGRYTSEGLIDRSFSADGVALIPVGPSNDVAYHSALMPDGRIVVLGSNLFEVQAARYLPDGRLDPSFDSDGLKRIELPLDVWYSQTSAVVVQPDGKIAVAGYLRRYGVAQSFSTIFVMRFDSDGQLDSGFGNSGQLLLDLDVDCEANAMILQPDGKILVGGVNNNRAILIRLNVNGTLDTSFRTTGISTMATTDSVISSLVLQPDGRILAAGWVRPIFESNSTTSTVLLVTRFRPNGAIDSTFGTNGRLVDPGSVLRAAVDIELLPDGSFVVAGNTTRLIDGVQQSHIAIGHYTGQGNTMGPIGTRMLRQTTPNQLNSFQVDPTSSWATALLRQPDGSLVVSGYTHTNMVVARVHPNGVIDSRFAGDGSFQLGASGERWRATNILQQPDGRLIATGHANANYGISTHSDFALVRLQNQTVPQSSTRVFLSAQGSIEIADQWSRDDHWAISSTESDIVLDDLSADGLSSFEVNNLPGVEGNGTRSLRIPKSLIEATGRPLSISGLGGNDHLLVRNDQFDAPLTGLIFRGSTGNDRISMDEYNLPINWILSAATSGSARPVGRVPITFTSVEDLRGGRNVDHFRLLFQGSSERIMIDGGAGPVDQIELRADGDFEFTQQLFNATGQRLIVTAETRQEYLLRNIERATLRGGNGNNRIDAHNFLGTAFLYGGDGDDVLIGPQQFPSEQFGGNGNDTLVGGIARDILRGGSGDDVLIGNDGDDQLFGDDGHDILIGGHSLDELHGGLGDDLLIGGNVPYFARLADPTTTAARDAIVDTWRSALTYAQKIQNLTVTGVGADNQVRLVKNSTVFNDFGLDTYFGNGGTDWFWLDIETEFGLVSGGVRDRAVDEVINDV